MKKKVSFVFLVILAVIIVVFIWYKLFNNFSSQSVSDKRKNITQSNSKKPLSSQKEDLLIKEIEKDKLPIPDYLLVKYKKKYESLSWFLYDKKDLTKSWLNLDISKEDFVICLTWFNTTWLMYVNFKQDHIKNGFYDNKYKYDYMYYIDQAIKNNCIYWWLKTKATKQIIFESDLQHPLKDTLNKIFSKKVNVFSVLKELEKVPKLDKDHKELLAYLYDFIWDYQKAANVRKQLPDIKVKVRILWQITDEDWKPISNATIYLINNPLKKTTSDEKWFYNLSFDYYPFAHLRIRAYKKWFSDWYYTIPLDRVLMPNWTKIVEKDFVLNKPLSTYTINWWEKKEDTTLVGKKYYIFKTKQSTYFVPVDWLYYMNNKRFKSWKISVYLYEFNKWSKIDDLTNSDTFAPVYWYVGNLMKTFWMPYIQFFDDKNHELFIKSSNPMILINKIYHMKELYTNYDKIYEPITDKDMEFLYNVSKKWWYPITYNWLIENHFLRWPCWWILDRKKGTWISAPHKVIDKSGIVQLEFYHIKE